MKEFIRTTAKTSIGPNLNMNFFYNNLEFLLKEDVYSFLNIVPNLIISQTPGCMSIKQQQKHQPMVVRNVEEQQK